MRVNFIGFALTVGIVVGAPMPSTMADRCEVVACWRECHRVPGGHACGKRCQHRCWREPAYIPPPYHAELPLDPPPQQQWHAPPPAAAATDHVTVLLVLGGVAVLTLFGIAALLASSSTDLIRHDTAETLATVAEAERLAADAEAKTGEIDSFIQQQTAQAYEAGYRGLPEPRNG